MRRRVRVRAHESAWWGATITKGVDNVGAHPGAKDARGDLGRSWPAHSSRRSSPRAPQPAPRRCPRTCHRRRSPGSPSTGETLTASLGAWTGTPPISYAAAWHRCDAAGAGCAAVGGQTTQTYAVTTADIGSTLRFVVTATNGEGTVSAAVAADCGGHGADGAREHRRPRGHRVGRGGLDADDDDRHVDRHGDHVRVPVGAVRCRRRTPRRLGLPVDPGSDELELHARRRRHRATSSRAGDRVERRRIRRRGIESRRRR